MADKGKKTSATLEVKIAEPANTAKAAKDATRFKQIMRDHAVRSEPRRIPCHLILPSKFNRLLNVHYIHEDLGPRILSKGCDLSRPNPGLIRRLGTTESKRDVIRYSQTLMKQVPGWLPPIECTENDDVRECLGGQHLTTTIHCYSCGMRSPTGFIFAVPDDDDEFPVWLKSGHEYIELDSTLSDEDATFVAEYVNADQNQNNFNSEMHFQRQVRTAAEPILSKTPYVKPAAIVHAVIAASSVKLRPESISDMAVWVVPFHGSDHLFELEQYHAFHVNPKELAVSASWFASNRRTLGKDVPIFQRVTAMVHYSGEVKLDQTRPAPDISRVISEPMLNLAVSKGIHLEAETVLREINETIGANLVKRLGEKATTHRWQLEIAIGRLAYCMDLSKLPFAHFVSGKWDLQKAKELKLSWLADLEVQVPETFGLAAELGLNIKEAPVVAISRCLRVGFL